MMATSANGISIFSERSGSGGGNSRGSSSDTSNGREINTSLVCNSSQRGRHYGTVNRGLWRENGYLIHTITSIDTLQGIALKYEVPVSVIQRANQLVGNESIHKFRELKIPYLSNSRQCTPQSSPQASRKTKNSTRTASTEILTTLSTEEVEEEEVKSKPKQVENQNGEKDIMSLLSRVDQQLIVSKGFADRLATKSALLTEPSDAYNRPRTHEQQQQEENNSYEDSFKSKLKRTFMRPTVWSPAQDSENREKVENEIFEL